MAKGQKRSTREIRKPKQVKTVEKTDNTFLGKVKSGDNALNSRLQTKA